MTDPVFIQASDALAALDEAVTALRKLDGVAIPLPGSGKSRTGEMAQLTRELLRIDHLLNRAKLSVMEEYWFVKEPSTIPDASTERAT